MSNALRRPRGLWTLVVGLVAAGGVSCGKTSDTAGWEQPDGGGTGSVAGAAGAGASAGSAGTGALGGTGGGAGSAGSAGSGGTGRALLGPPYPIVLAHGWFGFEEFAGVGFATYFFGIKDHLASQGEHLVLTPAVDPYNSSEIRGAQLLAHVESFLKDTGYAKVNIIGHSQGGLDARVVAHDRPDLVASVLTIATPHYGTPIGDVATGVVSPDGAAADVLDWFVKQAAGVLWSAAGDDTSVMRSFEQFAQPGIQAFNAKYTDSPSVPYFSITGRSGDHLGNEDCKPDERVAFVEDYNGRKDPIDALFVIPESYLDGEFLGKGDPNDGLVRARDARWGTFLGCVPADHLDEVGHLVGDKPGLFNDWEYKDFYVDLVKFIRARGY